MMTAEGPTAIPPLSAGPERPAARVTTTGPIRVLVVDDKPIVREGVCALLDQQPGVRVVAQAGSLAEAIASDSDADVALVDLVLPDATGTAIVAALQMRFAGVAVVVLSDVEARPHVEVVLAAGASAYVPKRATISELVTGIRSAAQGVQYVHPSIGAHAADGGSPRGNGTDAPLTATEVEVARLLVLGHTNAEIATLCDVSLRTVEARRARVLRKLGVRTRAELVRVAPQLGSTTLHTR